MEFLSAPWWSALLAIILIDLVLAGDNAIVIALAARSRLAVVLEMAINNRRSRAVGCRLAMMEDSSRSISSSMALTRASV